jgi:hypothetical protein
VHSPSRTHDAAIGNETSEDQRASCERKSAQLQTPARTHAPACVNVTAFQRAIASRSQAMRSRRVSRNPSTSRREPTLAPICSKLPSVPPSVKMTSPCRARLAAV